MLKNYIVVMLRNLNKRRFYFAINTLGLTVAISFAFVISIFIHGELKVNQDLRDVDRLYMVQMKLPDFNIMVPARLSQSAVQNYPNVFEDSYRFWDRSITVSKNEKHFRMDSMIGDSTFFEMFGFPLLHGEPRTALTEINSMVIDESTALRFFNRADVVGETLTISTERSGQKEFKISAVIADPSRKNTITQLSNMRAHVFLPIQNVSDFLTQADPDGWDGIISYVKLRTGVPVQDAEKALDNILKKDAPLSVSEDVTLTLASIKNFYMDGAVRQQVVSLGLIVAFILFLAVVNFVNISISTSFSRLKEVGVRKVIGGQRKGVIIQFLLESVTISLFAGVLALFVYQLVYPAASELLGSPLPSLSMLGPGFWLTVISGILILGILAGAYPSFYLSVSRPVESLKGKLKSLKGTIQFSRGLIVLQFSATVFVFVTAVVLSRQINFFLEKDMGYNKSSVLIVSSVPRIFSPQGFQKMETAKQEFLRSANVSSVSLSWGVPCWNFMSGGGRMYSSDKSVEQGVSVFLNGSDEDYLDVYQVKLSEGSFVKGEGRQPNSLVINKTAQQALGVRVGDKVKVEDLGDAEFIISGIIEDFNFESLQEKVKPLAFMHYQDLAMFRYFSFRLEPGNLAEAVQEVEKTWKNVFPDDPFVYDFADERVKTTYATELQLKRASAIATVLMFVIVLMGVLGLVALGVSKRTKEFGIRKVLGASPISIVLLISGEYLLLMGVSFATGLPCAYYFSNEWLSAFAYHIDISGWMLVIPPFIIFLITLMIISVQTLKAAVSNPARSLKYE